MGEELNNRAVKLSMKRQDRIGPPTILKDRRAVQFEAGLVGVLIFLCVTHCCSQPVAIQQTLNLTRRIRSGLRSSCPRLEEKRANYDLVIHRLPNDHVEMQDLEVEIVEIHNRLYQVQVKLCRSQVFVQL